MADKKKPKKEEKKKPRQVTSDDVWGIGPNGGLARDAARKIEERRKKLQSI